MRSHLEITILLFCLCATANGFVEESNDEDGKIVDVNEKIELIESLPIVYDYGREVKPLFLEDTLQMPSPNTEVGFMERIEVYSDEGKWLALPGNEVEKPHPAAIQVEEDKDKPKKVRFVANGPSGDVIGGTFDTMDEVKRHMAATIANQTPITTAASFDTDALAPADEHLCGITNKTEETLQHINALYQKLVEEYQTYHAITQQELSILEANVQSMATVAVLAAFILFSTAIVLLIVACYWPTIIHKAKKIFVTVKFDGKERDSINEALLENGLTQGTVTPVNNSEYGSNVRLISE